MKYHHDENLKKNLVKMMRFTSSFLQRQMIQLLQIFSW